MFENIREASQDAMLEKANAFIKKVWPRTARNDKAAAILVNLCYLFIR